MTAGANYCPRPAQPPLECGEKGTSAFCDSIGAQEKEVI